MSTPPRSLAWRSVSAQGAWPARARASTAARPAAPASGARPWSSPISVGAERVERPVLQEDVDRLAERGGAGGQDRGGLELVVGPGEEDQVQGLVHDGHLDARVDGQSDGMRTGGQRRDAADPIAALAAISPRRREAALEDVAHEAAGDHDVRVGQPVADLAAVALGLDEAGRAEHARGAARRSAGWRRWSRPGGRPRAVRAASGCRISRRRGLASVLRTSAWRIVISSMALTIDICADADECRQARSGGPQVTRPRGIHASRPATEWQMALPDRRGETLGLGSAARPPGWRCDPCEISLRSCSPRSPCCCRSD